MHRVNFRHGVMPGLALAALSWAVAPARAEVIDSTPQGFRVVHSIEVDAGPESVWRALEEPAGWWHPDHTWSGDAANLSLEVVPGGCFCETWDGGASAHLDVVRVEEGRLLRLQGGLGPLQARPVTGLLDWRLEPGDEGRTSITLDYHVAGVAGSDWANPVDGVLALQVARLAQFAETGKPAADADE